MALRSFVRDESGATAIEYGIIAALIFVVIIVSLQLLGGGVDGMWTRNTNAIVGAL